MSSAQLAASAAFRANNQSKDPIADSNGPKPVPKTAPRTQSPRPRAPVKPESRAGVAAQKKPTEQPNLSLAAATMTTQASLQKNNSSSKSRKPSLRIDVGSGSSTPPSALATSAADFSARNRKPSFDPTSAYSSPAVRTPATAAAVSSTEKLSSAFEPRGANDDETVSYSSVSNDYFGIPKSSRPDSAAATPRSRHSLAMDPKEMLDSVKHSINSKAKVGHTISKDTGERSRKALEEFRHAVESKRRASHFSQDSNGSTLNFLHSAGGNELHLSTSSLVSGASDSSSPTYEHHIFNIASLKDQNPSRISMDSFVSVEDAETPVTPSIAIVDTDKEQEIEQRRSSGAADTAAIPIPPSSIAVAREAAVAGVDPITNLSRSATNLSDTKVEEHIKKGRRKPPPDWVDSEPSALRPSFERSLSSASSGADEDTKLPQFPDITEKKKHHHHHHRIFGKRKDEAQAEKERSSFDSLNEMVAEEETPPDAKPTRGLPPVIPNSPHFALKTTMRKTNKRKEKKKAFDENKPWKNHEALEAISANERKRYEGVWVSNKGLYLDKVVTPLVGVDYSKDHSAEEKKRKDEEILNLAPSELAARLSTAVEASASDNMEEHIRERHGLNEADPHELIHGIVVKRIWRRSRLPDETLAAIWDLVDFRKDGTLNKPEFVVGMWLVDQCLYGRKLPKVVDERVWNSLGNIGVNVVIRKKKR